jgi:S-adenosylmethionine:tRNA ribosyltransferase-isomerase
LTKKSVARNVTEPPRQMTKRQLSKHEREQRLIRIARLGGIGLFAVILLVLAFGYWTEVLAKPGRKVQKGVEILFGGGRIRAKVLGIIDDGMRKVRFEYEGVFEEALDEVGVMPLPPYIHATLKDRERYQTVYSRVTGSAAAPTAGLHFTPELMETIRAKGIPIVPVLLHVGLGTFRPVKVEDVTQHVMHSEYYEVSEQAAKTLNDRRAKGGRIVCVGTTSARTLETVTTDDGIVHAASGQTSIFI